MPKNDSRSRGVDSGTHRTFYWIREQATSHGWKVTHAWQTDAPKIDGTPVDKFIAANADPIWLHQNEMWEVISLRDGYG